MTVTNPSLARLRQSALTRPIALGIPAAVWLVAALVVIALLAVASAYGFHRDEMYFILAGRHPDWGYDDQPPITPLLAAGSAQLLGTSPFAIRILPALAVAAVILMTASMARTFGGSTRAQVLAAIVMSTSMLVGAGHLMATATFDILGWTVILWLVLPILSAPAEAPTPWRRWLLLGVVAGLSLQNKNLPVFLAATLLAGLVLARRWQILRSPALWAALAIALAIWLPNIVWQAAHDFPQLKMAGNISGDQGGLGNRIKFFVELAFLLGPFLFPVPVAGAAWLLRARDAGPWRPVGIAFFTLVVLMLVLGGKSYYTAGFFAVLIAAGATRLDGWLDRGRLWLRRSTFTGAAVISGAIVAIVALPIVPVESLHSTPIPSLYSESAAQVGWPQLAAQVEGIVATLTPAQREHAVIFTPNYGVYGALELYGKGLPPAYSGHVSVAYWGQPRDGDGPVILVAFEPSWLNWVTGCRAAATIDNGLGVETEEQGSHIYVCDGPDRPWSVMWPDLHHDS